MKICMNKIKKKNVTRMYEAHFHPDTEVSFTVHV